MCIYKYTLKEYSLKKVFLASEWLHLLEEFYKILSLTY